MGWVVTYAMARNVNKIIAGVTKLARRVVGGGAEDSLGVNWKRREVEGLHVQCVGSPCVCANACLNRCDCCENSLKYV